jgi:dienelactone hydrolase
MLVLSWAKRADVVRAEAPLLNSHNFQARTEANADCEAFSIQGDPRAMAGATWTYRSTDSGVPYSLEGVLFIPAGSGPFPGIVISHGKGGSARNYSSNIARQVVNWGLVVIATNYTHASEQVEAGNEPKGPDGASEANVLRAHKARDLLSCLNLVDLNRVAAHGHSMGAFVTGQLLGSFPADFLVASHTAGGVSQGPNATRRDAAELIVTPYQLHHGDLDTVVALFQDQTLANILAANSVDYEFIVYPGYDHQEITTDELMLNRVREWYEGHGLFESATDIPTIEDARVKGKKLIVSGAFFDSGAVIVVDGEDQKTKNDDGSSSTRLIAKKAGRLIPPGNTVTLQVRNPGGATSTDFVFRRP